MAAIQTITLIGAGRLAWHLGQRLYTCGIRIQQVYSRQFSNAQALAQKVKANPTDQLSALQSGVDLYILAVPDGAISEVAAQLQGGLSENALLVHTSGATPSVILADYFSNYGCFYPLQSFSKEKKVDFSQIPVCVYAATDTDQQRLLALAQRISTKTEILTDQQRAALHVAAVIANNFTNYLFGVSQQICQQENIPFDLLRPLILETARKVQEHDPAAMQTGPASRGDQATIDRHLAYLENNKVWSVLYSLLSEEIRQGKGS